MTPEGKVKADYRAWLRKCGIFYYSPVPFGYGKDHIDDFVCHRGYFLALEAKRPDTRPGPTERQENTLKSVFQNGGHAAVVYSLADVIEIISEIDKLPMIVGLLRLPE